MRVFAAQSINLQLGVKKLVRKEDLYSLLLDIAQKDLYLQNAFRILNLSVGTSEREIKRSLERIQMEARLGNNGQSNDNDAQVNDRNSDTQISFRSREYPILEITYSINEKRAVAQRLEASGKCFIDEFFCLWPINHRKGSSDKAPDAIIKEDYQ